MGRMNYADADTFHYENLKILIEAYTGLERDALHIHVALILYFLAMLVCRRSRFPWIVVLLFELANEALDLNRQHLNGMPLDWHESAKDLWNTMLWPTVLLLVGRYTDLFQHRPHHRHAKPEEKAAPTE